MPFLLSASVVPALRQKNEERVTRRVGDARLDHRPATRPARARESLLHVEWDIAEERSVRSNHLNLTGRCPRGHSGGNFGGRNDRE